MRAQGDRGLLRSTARRSARARSLAKSLAREKAREAGADDVHVETEQHDLRAPGLGGEEIFIETSVTATAIGRPNLARIATSVNRC